MGQGKNDQDPCSGSGEKKQKSKDCKYVFCEGKTTLSTV